MPPFPIGFASGGVGVDEALAGVLGALVVPTSQSVEAAETVGGSPCGAPKKQIEGKKKRKTNKKKSRK